MSLRDDSSSDWIEGIAALEQWRVGRSRRSYKIDRIDVSRRYMDTIAPEELRWVVTLYENGREKASQMSASIWVSADKAIKGGM